MAALEIEVMELMAKHTAVRLSGLVERIRGLATPKSGGARRRGTLAPPALSKVCGETGAEGR
jgi:hypothetical protein